MEIAILDFIEYLRKTKHSSLNTEVSYERDLIELRDLNRVLFCI